MVFGASISMIIIACLSVIAIKYEITEVAILGSVLCGAVLGFLLFNLHPAKIFMGDTGSLLLRWRDFQHGDLFANSNFFTNYSNYPNFRNNIGYFASMVFQKNRKEIVQNVAIASSF